MIQCHFPQLSVLLVHAVRFEHPGGRSDIDAAVERVVPLPNLPPFQPARAARRVRTLAGFSKDPFSSVYEEPMCGIQSFD
jgi:hypothetical protein